MHFLFAVSCHKGQSHNNVSPNFHACMYVYGQSKQRNSLRTSLVIPSLWEKLKGTNRGQQRRILPVMGNSQTVKLFENFQ